MTTKTNDKNQLSESTPGDYTTGSAVSKDGTRIGYRQIGRGPGLIILHGAMVSSQNFMQLAEHLSDTFTVYVPDRRGRGLSEPFGNNYDIQKEVEDLEALLEKTGAHNVFGVSAGGLIALQGALTTRTIHKIALYEPALLLYGAKYTSWLARYDEEMAQGNVAGALITSMKGLRLGPPIFNAMPRWLLESLTNKVMAAEDKKAKDGEMTMRMLAPTLHYDGQLLEEMAGNIERFRSVSADVMLLSGSKGLTYLRPSLDVLETVISGTKRIEFPGLDHAGACDVSNSNRNGQPAVIAQELRRFFCLTQ